MLSLRPIIYLKQMRWAHWSAVSPVQLAQKPWVKQSKDSALIWKPEKGRLLCCRWRRRGQAIFSRVPLLRFPILCIQVAVWSNKSTNKDWVVEKFSKDRDGDTKKVRHFEAIPASERRSKPHRHCADKDTNLPFPLTMWFIGSDKLATPHHRKGSSQKRRELRMGE